LQGVMCAVAAASNTDVNCATFNNGMCVNCSKGYYLSQQGPCIQFNPLCKTSDPQTGACLSCYPGYALSAGSCLVGNGPTTSGDVNCKTSGPTGSCA
jgi:hypothetical protein